METDLSDTKSILLNGYVFVLPEVTPVRKKLSEATMEELLELYTEFRSVMPSFGCDTASKMLAEIYDEVCLIPLIDGAFKPFRHEFDELSFSYRVHSFVIQKDEKAIVDITADQFGVKNFGPVVRVYPPDYEYGWYHFKNNCELNAIDCSCHLAI